MKFYQFYGNCDCNSFKMRITPALFRQHIGRMFKIHWRIQGQRVPIETDAEAHLKALGVKIFNPNEVVKQVRKDIK